MRTIFYTALMVCCGCADIYIPPTSQPQRSAEAPAAKPKAVKAEAAEPQATASKPKVLIIGDSISMENIGYFNHLKAQIGDRFELVHNPGNGSDSGNVLTHLDEWVTTMKPDIIHFNCGLHDLRTDFGKPSEQKQPPEAYERNLQEIVNYLKTRTKAKLIFALTTPTNEAWHKNKGFDRFEAYVRKYNEIAREIMIRNEVPMNDLYTLVMNAGANNVLLPDGVHMNDAGKELCANAVASAIEQAAIAIVRKE